MLARQRQTLILEELRRAGAVRVSELTELLDVSDMTIRRDLEGLADFGVVAAVDVVITTTRCRPTPGPPSRTPSTS
jgi:DeoR/GlpR family transcriptional regulator of sugar metabolism